jgi:acyl-coenzyme A synthetase/AMP-(fatty) acid ligase
MPNMTDYEATHDRYSLEVPEFFNYTTDVVDRRAVETPEHPALVALESDGITAHRFDCATVSALANRAANLLESLGVRRGDRVLVQLPRIPEWYWVLLGCFKLGAVPLPGTTMLTEGDIEHRVNQAEATAAVADTDGAAKVERVRAQCPSLRSLIVVGPSTGGWVSFPEGMGEASDALIDRGPTRADDPLLIYFTSGTVAYPKMVLHTHASYGIGHEITARFWHDLGPDDLHWTVSDTGWAKAAWGKLFGQWRVGAAVLLWDIKGKPDLDRMLRVIGEQKVTGFCAPPTVYRGFVQLDLGEYDWSSLRHCTSAGEPLNPEVIAVWKEATGLTIYDGYGQTETVNIVANYQALPVKPGSMGRPAPGFDVRIVDDDGTELSPSEEGHIAVRVEPQRPVGLFREYWRDPERTAQVFRNGWYLTGDRGTVDEDGYIWFVGRADDVIISAAYRIGPFEVESALIEHPAVMEAAVVGKPDAERGQIVKAYLILVPGWEESDALVEELKAHCRRVTAPYKYPREIEFVSDLPKTISGKIRRVELRQRG